MFLDRRPSVFRTLLLIKATVVFFSLKILREKFYFSKIRFLKSVQKVNRKKINIFCDVDCFIYFSIFLYQNNYNFFS